MARLPSGDFSVSGAGTGCAMAAAAHRADRTRDCRIAYQYVARPPERSKMKPVVKLHSGDTIHAAMAATSSSVPQRCMGILAVMYDTVSAGSARTRSVMITAGARPFTVTPELAHS